MLILIFNGGPLGPPPPPPAITAYPGHGPTTIVALSGVQATIPEGDVLADILAGTGRRTTID